MVSGAVARVTVRALCRRLGDRRTGPPVRGGGGPNRSGETGRGPGGGGGPQPQRKQDATSAETPGGDMGRDATHPDRAPRVVVLAGAYGSFFQPVVDISTGAGHAPDLVAPTIWARCSSDATRPTDRQGMAAPGRSGPLVSPARGTSAAPAASWMSSPSASAAPTSVSADWRRSTPACCLPPPISSQTALDSNHLDPPRGRDRQGAGAACVLVARGRGAPRLARTSRRSVAPQLAPPERPCRPA